MKLDLFTDKANKIWKRISDSEECPDNLFSLKFDLYKKLLIFFQIGESCYFVFNFQQLKFDFVSEGITSVLGYDKEEINTQTIIESIHPDDRTWFLNCQEVASKFVLKLSPEKRMKYKLRFDYRFKRKDGEYITVMHQSVVVQTGEAGEIFRTLVVYTDISHLKKNTPPVMSYMGMDGEPSYLNVAVKNIYSSKEKGLSNREREILYHISEGKSSKMICDILNISKYTVDFHRKKILRKTGFKNTGEVISNAIREGWI